MATPLSMIFEILATDSASDVFKRIGAAAQVSADKQMAADKAVTGSYEQRIARLRELGVLNVEQQRELDSLLIRQDQEMYAKQAATDAAAADKRAETFKAGAAKLATGLAAAGAVVAVVSLKMAADFQQNVTKLATTAGESAGNLKMVGDGMLDLAGKVGISSDDLAKGMYIVESAGIHGADALNVLKVAAQGAKQEQADLGKTTDALTTILHDYNIPASASATVMSQLVTAVSTGKTTLEDFTGSLHSVTPLAAALHVPLQDILGDLAAMTASGESADQATQNMADAMRHLQTPTAQMTSYLAQVGITSQDLATDLSTKGLAGSMQEIEQAILQHIDPATQRVLLPAFNQSKLAAADMQTMIGKMPGTLGKLSQGLLDGSVTIKQYQTAVRNMGGQQAAAGSQFLALYKQADGFNNVIKAGGPSAQVFSSALAKATGDSAGLTVALQLTGVHAGTLNENIKKIAGSSGDASGNIKGWSEVQGNFNQQLSEAKSSVGAMAIQLGEKLLPAATAAFGWINDHGLPALRGLGGALKDVGDFISGHGTLFGSLAAAAGAGAAAFVLWTGAVKGWELITKGAIAVQALFNGVMDANPIMLVVVAVAALAAGLIYAYEHSKTFRDVVQTVLHDVGGFFDNVWKNGIKPAIDGIITGFDWVVNAGKTVGGALATAWNAVTGAMATVWGSVTGAAHDVASAVSTAWGAISHAWDATWRAVTGVWDAVEPVLHKIGEVFYVILAAPFVIASLAVSKAWDAVWGALQTVWNSVGKPALHAVTDEAQRFWSGLQRIWGWIGDGWNAVVTGLKGAWDHTGGPLIAFIQDAEQRFWLGLQRIWGWIGSGWNAMVTGLKIVWDHTGGPLITWITDESQRFWLGLQRIWGWISGAWSATVTGLKVVWDHTGGPLITGIQNVSNDLWNALKRIWGWIGDGWNSLITGMKKLYDSILAGVFSVFSGAVSGLSKTFDTAVKAIGIAWNKIEDIAKAPVKFVIDTVLNQGLIAGWDWIVNKLGVKDLNVGPIPLPFAVGGEVPGFSPHDEADNIPAMLTAGEFVVRKSIAQKVPNFLKALNGGQSEAVQAAGGPGATMRGYAAGGAVDNALSVARSMQGKPYIWAAASPAGADCSGYMSIVTNALRGEANPYFRLGTTETMPWPGFQTGLNGQWALGNHRNNGNMEGHTAGTLAGHNMESGSGHGPMVDGNALGALSSYFYEHYWLPEAGGVFTPGGAGGGSSASSSAPSWWSTLWGSVTGAFNWLKGKISAVGDMGSKFGNNDFTKMVAAVPGKAVDAVWTKGKDLVGNLFSNIAGAVVNNVLTDNASVAGAKSAVQNVAKNPLFGWGDGAEWNAIDWIVNHESSWRANAVNPSGASGLFQLMPGTWNADADNPGQFRSAADAPADQQAWAGLRYIKGRYGDPINAQAFWAAHNWYSAGGPVASFDAGTNYVPRTGLAMVHQGETIIPRDRQGAPYSTGPAVFNLYDSDGVLMGTIRGEIARDQQASALRASAGSSSALR